jgi:2-oxo-4-hydroxy-4-carboxy-5-ureidoimidazoline decarboxylase
MAGCRPIESPIPSIMSTTPPALTLAAVNRMGRDEFVGAFGGIFEHSPWVADAAWRVAPFSSLVALHEAMVAAVRSALPERQLDLIRAHPDLAGKAARSGAITAASVSEQAGAGLLSLSDDEYDRIHRLNIAYRKRFGFPFIVAVRQHDKASLLAAFERRLSHSRADEIESALGQIFTIARFRLDTAFGAAGS